MVLPNLLSVNGNSIIQVLQDQKPLCDPEFVSISHTPQANTNKSVGLGHSNITQLRQLSHNLHCYYPSPSHHNPRLTHCKSLLTGLCVSIHALPTVCPKHEDLCKVRKTPMASFLTHSKLQGPYDLRGCVHTSCASVVLVQPPWTNRPSVLLSTLPAGLLSEIHTWLIADFLLSAGSASWDSPSLTVRTSSPAPLQHSFCLTSLLCLSS